MRRVMRRLLGGLMAVGFTTGAVSVLAMCGTEGGETYPMEQAAAAVCTNASGERVDDSFCGSQSGPGMGTFLWFYLLSTMNQPAIGAQVVHNTYYSGASNPYASYYRKAPPKNADVYYSVPKTGWKPSASTQTFTSTKKVNATAPKVIVQQPKPMYQPKPGSVNKPPAPYKAPPPAYKPPVKR